MEPVRVWVYDWHGEPVCELPYTSCDWSESIGEAGSMNVRVVYSREAERVPGGLRSVLKLWGSILAAVRGRDVVHAGWLTGYDWDPGSMTLDLTCGGGWTILSKRLVLGHGLDGGWRDGDVLIDEQHPAGAWRTTYTGSYLDIASGLVSEAMQWGDLPFILPAREGGGHERTYAGYDLATVLDRLEDLTRLADGVELRSDPQLSESGRLAWRLRGAAEIVDHSYTADGLGVLSAAAPGSRVRLAHAHGEGSGMTGQVYATGGKDQDRTLMCRGTRPIEGLPLLQTGDTEHTTVSELGTLRAHVAGDLAYGASPDGTIRLQVGEEIRLMPGDHMDVQVDDLWLGEVLLRLKVTDVSGSADSDWQDIQARERS